MGDALKSQKKGLKLNVTRMGYLRRTIAKIERVRVWLKLQKVRAWLKLWFKMQCISAWLKLSAKRARWVERFGSPSGGPTVHILVYRLGLTQRLTNFSALITPYWLTYQTRTGFGAIEMRCGIRATIL